ncbi:MFS transporter [Flavobacterium ardleyense]|uniref:MFS transporter n=1 Tax=Flavobacterium ardleyense TaxID=2038737 RepID=UPI00298C0676|nr:MFS transporter [Flavobacterium ardleyense]
MQNLPKGSKKLINAWAFYDWANSVYTLVIASSIFPIYYGALFKLKGTLYIEAFGSNFKSTALISFVTAAAFLVVAILSPLLSGIADYAGNKKLFLKFFCYLGASSCIGLYWFSLENIYIGLLFYFLALIGFWGSLVFYNSYLPDIAFPDQQDAASAKGYSIGYLGSVVLLLINLAMVMTAESNEAALSAMKLSFIMVGVWWIVFSQYTFYYLPKGQRKVGYIANKSLIFGGFKELKKVWISLSTNPILKKYLSSFFIYSMAVQTVMLVATYFGEQEISWKDDSQKTSGLIISILVIQLVAVVGAQITSLLSSKIGNIRTLILINSIWVAICLGAYFVTTPFHFYLTAGFVGLVMGGIQSLSRSTYSKLLPETQDTASYFSFYDVAEKIGIVIGMCIYGVIDQITGSPRLAILFLALFFIVGVIMLNHLRIYSKKNAISFYSPN